MGTSVIIIEIPNLKILYNNCQAETNTDVKYQRSRVVFFGGEGAIHISAGYVMSN